MEYSGFWVTRKGVKPMDKNTSNIKYEATYFLKINMSVYGYNEKITQYVGMMITYVIAFN